MKYILLITEMVLLIFGIRRARKDRDLFNPYFIFSCPLLISLLINLLYYDNKYEIKSSTYFIYFISVVALSLGFAIGSNLNVVLSVRKGNECKQTVYKALWYFAFISVFFAIGQIIAGARFGIYGNNYINNIRYYSQYVQEGNFFATYGKVAADTLMIYLMYRYYICGDRSRRTKKAMIFAIILYIVYVLEVFNRTELMYFLCLFGFFFTKKNREVSKKRKKQTVYIIIAALLMVIAFNYIAVQTNKESIGVNNDPWLIFYFGSEFYWLQRFALSVNFHTYGAFSLSIFSRLLRLIGVFNTENLSYYSSLLRSYGNPVSSFCVCPLFGLWLFWFFHITSFRYILWMAI